MRTALAALLVVAATSCHATAGGGYIWVEAEKPRDPDRAFLGDLKVGPLTTRPYPGSTTFIGEYIGIPGVHTKDHAASDAAAAYDIEVPRTGLWTVWARACWFVGSADTFSVGIDNAPFRRLICDGRYGNWEWVKAGDFQLKAGRHTVRWRCDGAGVRLDKFLLTDDVDLSLCLVTGRYEDYPNTNREVDGHISLTKHVYRDCEAVRAALYLISREPKDGLVAEMRVLWQGASIWVDRKPASVGSGLTKVVFNWPLAFEPEGEYTLVAVVTDASGRKLAEAREVVGKLGERSEREWRSEQAEVGALAGKLRALIEKAEKKGLDAAYPAVSLAVMECFQPFAEEDFAAGRVARARWTTGYLVDCGERAMHEVRELIARPETNRPVPRYRAGRCEIRDGAFWQDGRPVFFVGFGHFDQVIHDIPVLSRMGFNIIQPESGAYFVLPDEGVIDHDVVRQMRWTLDRAAANGVSVNLMLSPHYFPTWVGLKHPDIVPPKGIHGGFSRYVIEDERARDVLRTYLKAIISAIKDHPALHSYALSNEPKYGNVTPLGLARFREWLKARHGSIAELNALYGTSYADFAEVQFPTRESPRAPRYDWHVYKQQMLLEFHQFLKDAVRELDPDTPVHIKQMGGLFTTEDHSTNGVNHEDFTLLSDISGNDGWNPYNAGDWRPDNGPEFEYDQDWRIQAMYYDFQRSIAPDHPVQNSENHMIKDFDPAPWPARHGRAALWNGAVHGQGATTMWLWDRWSWKYYPCDLNAHRPDWADVTGRTALDLMRLGKYFAAFPHERAHLAVLFSSACILDGENIYMLEARNSYEALYFTGARVDFVTERQCAAGRLSEYRILIVPDARFVSGATVEAIRRFAEAGGEVIVIAEGLSADEYGRKRDLAGLIPADGDIRIGAGRVRRMSGGMSPRELAGVYESLLDQTDIPRLARARNLDGTMAWGVGCRSAMVDGKPAVSLVNFCRESASVRIESAAGASAWKNLVTGRMFSGPIPLEPLSPMLLVPSN